jgi:hypothetical protein
VAGCACSVLVTGAGPVAAYNGASAAWYADVYARGYNSAYPEFSTDCTNFVSQAVHYGGFSMVGGSSSTSDTQWWIHTLTYGWAWSHSWSVAVDYDSFLWQDSPGGIGQGTAPGTATYYYTPNSVVTGDALFYDWGQGEGISHVAIQVGIGTDPNYPNGQTWYGNYIDEHTNNRYHAFWSLYPYNAAFRNTTTIYFMHIYASNN